MTSALGAETSPGSASAAEVWLRGNPRPAVMLLAAAAAATAVIAGAVAALHPPAWVAGCLAIACGGVLASAAGIAWAASRPRLLRRGDVLEVRLAPLAVERIPLAVVECVFPGSQPLADAGTAERRVGTLVLRLAERAAEWRSRPATTWGAWHDGSVVFDGRWCEPLSQPLARDISAKLLEARRMVDGERQP